MRETRYVVPESGTLPLGVPPDSARIILIYSRTAKLDLQPDPATAADVEDEVGKTSSKIDRRLSRGIMEGSAQQLIMEKVATSGGANLREQAVYVVNPEAGLDATITMAIILPRR